MCLERQLEIRKTVKSRPRKLIKPRLPRKITNTCKINLNKFWDELEDFYLGEEKLRTLPMWPDLAEEEQQNCNNENVERERDAFLPTGRLDRYVFLLPPSPTSPASPPSPTSPSPSSPTLSPSSSPE